MKLKEKVMAELPKPQTQAIVKEVKPVIQNPDNTQKAKGKNLPGR